jgi:hypothetical protein
MVFVCLRENIELSLEATEEICTRLNIDRIKCVADHSAPSSAEVKKTWIYTSTPPYVFMAECI